MEKSPDLDHFSEQNDRSSVKHKRLERRILRVELDLPAARPEGP